MFASARNPLLIALLLGALLLSGCAMIAPAASDGAMGDMAESSEEMALPAPQPGVISAEMVRARPAPLEGGNGAAFMVVLNGTDAPVQLLSAASDVADVVELHETSMVDGVMKMEPHPEGFEVPAGGALELKPGGKHVMFLGLVAPLEVGKSFSVTLSFDDGTTLPLSVPVVEMEGMPGMGN